jgi:hypothetical protein
MINLLHGLSTFGRTVAINYSHDVVNHNVAQDVELGRGFVPPGRFFKLQNSSGGTKATRSAASGPFSRVCQILVVKYPIRLRSGERGLPGGHAGWVVWPPPVQRCIILLGTDFSPPLDDDIDVDTSW